MKSLTPGKNNRSHNNRTGGKFPSLTQGIYLAAFLSLAVFLSSAGKTFAQTQYPAQYPSNVGAPGYPPPLGYPYSAYQRTIIPPPPYGYAGGVTTAGYPAGYSYGGYGAPAPVYAPPPPAYIPPPSYYAPSYAGGAPQLPPAGQGRPAFLDNPDGTYERVVTETAQTPAAAMEEMPEPSRDLAPWMGVVSEVRLGFGDHDAGVFGRTKESGYDVNMEVLFVDPDILDFMWSPRPTLGVSVNTSGDTSQLYGGLTWEWWFFEDFFADFFFGFAVHDGKLRTDDINRKELGSRVLFRESIDLGWNFYDRNMISIFLDHVSHGHMFADKNEGMDTLGVRYGYRF